MIAFAPSPHSALTGVITPVICRHEYSTCPGQISVPAEIRRKLGLGPGSVLEWDAEGEHVIVRKAGRYSSQDIHQALFAKSPKRRSFSELKNGARRYVEAKHARL